MPAAGPGGLSHLEVSPELNGGQEYVILLIPSPPLSPKTFEESSSLQSPQASNFLFCPLQIWGFPL